jgi:hypothetical protein
MRSVDYSKEGIAKIKHIEKFMILLFRYKLLKAIDLRGRSH